MFPTNPKTTAALIAALCTLIACGGKGGPDGGGGYGGSLGTDPTVGNTPTFTPTTDDTPTVAITEQTARAVAWAALRVTNDIRPSIAAQQWIYSAIPSVGTYNTSKKCANTTGSLTTNGTRVAFNIFTPKDNWSVNYTNCVYTFPDTGRTITFDGKVNTTVLSTSTAVGTTGSHNVFNTTFESSIVQLDIAPGVIETISGNQNADFLVTDANNQTLTYSGDSLLTYIVANSTETLGPQYSTKLNWVKYKSIFNIEAGVSSVSYTGAIQSSNNVFGSLGGVFQVTTATPFSNSGQLNITGTRGSQMKIIFNSATDIQLLIDANGDGKYESKINTDQQNLNSVTYR